MRHVAARQRASCKLCSVIQLGREVAAQCAWDLQTMTMTNCWLTLQLEHSRAEQTVLVGFELSSSRCGACAHRASRGLDHGIRKLTNAAFSSIASSR